MDERESTVSGSPWNSDTDSPTPVSSILRSQVMDMDNQNTNNIVVESMVIEKSDAGAVATTPAAGGSGGSGGFGNVGSGDLFGKKKRGRPRKYDADGKLRVVQPLMQHKIQTSAGVVVTSQPSGFSLSLPSPPPPSDRVFSSSKRGRGRPPGSGNWQLLASLGGIFANTAAGDFTPHVVTVYAGEDVAGKILTFSNNGQRGICVLSANGAVSNVTIRQPGSSGGILTYEGRFEILSLTGSFTVAETGGIRSRTGGLSISLAGADGRVIGGGVAGLLLAASPIQIVVGSFVPNGYKAHKRRHQRGQHISASVIQVSPDTLLAERPISQAKPDAETCTNPEFPLQRQGDEGIDNCTDKKQIPDSIIPHDECRNGREPSSIQRPSPAINLSLSNEEGVFWKLQLTTERSQPDLT